MQLASHGLRGIPRAPVPNLVHGGNASRSIHIPAYLRVKPPQVTPTSTKQIISKTRTLLARFIGNLTAPGIGHVSNATTPFAQAIRGSGPGRMNTIQQRLSYPVRTALARPAQSLYIPRAPTFASRSVAQVGLGTARNFHSGRSVFQNLVDNVPIAGRAFYEADWDVDVKSRQHLMKKMNTKKASENVSKEMLKPRNKVSSLKSSLNTDALEGSACEMDHYFTSPNTPNVTTYLLIPLAPTPTARVPLDPNGPGHPPLLPYSSLASIHNGHELHALRVSSLFTRLDAAKVWDKGVVCSSYASRADLDGVCTILKVEFTGWSVAEVRSVIGEAGTGWCVLEEERTQVESEDDDMLSDTSSIFTSSASPNWASTPPLDSATDTFVLPTLDFSSSFLDANEHDLPPLSRSSSSSEIFSDVNTMEYDDPWSDAALSDSESLSEISSSSSRLGFSSAFSRRSGIEEDSFEPREYLF